jgi:threonine synthase
MNYISTRGNHPPCTSAAAISLGMVPEGGLFVPESFPQLSSDKYIGEISYQNIAESVLQPLLTDFTNDELKQCIANAYTLSTFDTPDVIAMVDLDRSRSIMELWHGPTAAFKDVALQIMPHLMRFSKEKTGNTRHTVILVATSGDTGKAALEGFKDAQGISIVVFYPHGGVSEIQRLQMATTIGNNTSVIAVRGNFDDCQTGVKQLFADANLRRELTSNGVELSSANSINWGRLCPQIVYYFAAYGDLVRRGKIAADEKVNFAVPTGNFGNILAGYYALRMGLPINRLICASNKNRVLADFFTTGVYNRNRSFYRTSSPSMDILVSSNLERFLFEMCGRDGGRVSGWYDELSATGSFSVDTATMQAMQRVIAAGWIDEKHVLSTIRNVYTNNGYVLDTHTAVGVAICDTIGADETPTIIASTASPYKFSRDVVGALEETTTNDEFACVARLSSISGKPVHRALDTLRELPVRYDTVIDVGQMRQTVLQSISNGDK